MPFDPLIPLRICILKEHRSWRQMVVVTIFMGSYLWMHKIGNNPRIKQ